MDLGSFEIFYSFYWHNSWCNFYIEFLLLKPEFRFYKCSAKNVKQSWKFSKFIWPWFLFLGIRWGYKPSQTCKSCSFDGVKYVSHGKENIWLTPCWDEVVIIRRDDFLNGWGTWWWSVNQMIIDQLINVLSFILCRKNCAVCDEMPNS